MASLDPSNLQALSLAFRADFFSVGGADTGTSGHFDRPYGPINLQVMLFQLGKSKYKILLLNTDNHEHYLFVISIIPEYQLHHLSDWFFFVWGSIYIIDGDMSSQLMSIDLFCLHVL
jgi:hypothetical protein